MSLRSFLPLVAVLASTALACSSSSNNTDAGETSATDGSTTTTTGDSGTSSGDAASPTSDSGGGGGGGPSFATTVYAPVIEQHCLTCHGPLTDGGPGLGIEIGKLDMSSVDAGYANLVNVAAAGASCAQAGGTRVVPGSAATSLLYGKINGFTTAPICGKAMPESGEIPDGGQAIAVAAIEAWINGGALP